MAISTESIHVARDARALVQGTLVGLLQRYCIENKEAGILVELIEQDRDQYGNYLPFFTVEMESGARLKVSVDVT